MQPLPGRQGTRPVGHRGHRGHREHRGHRINSCTRRRRQLLARRHASDWLHNASH
ncbi:hypothetical protein RR42_m0695 [Cupriavidus basilensis]|uniref:Uncharacterized protein n=1 Tax=Cupriavidus basilensis TaxID=68895 RepID=A0A0C4XZX0_9BURK|nr:hypothetical protein RR42_m0695 [Cupriavidus basilensis]